MLSCMCFHSGLSSRSLGCDVLGMIEERFNAAEIAVLPNVAGFSDLLDGALTTYRIVSIPSLSSYSCRQGASFSVLWLRDGRLFVFPSPVSNDLHILLLILAASCHQVIHKVSTNFWQLL